MVVSAFHNSITRRLGSNFISLDSSCIHYRHGLDVGESFFFLSLSKFCWFQYGDSIIAAALVDILKR